MNQRSEGLPSWLFVKVSSFSRFLQKKVEGFIQPSVPLRAPKRKKENIVHLSVIILSQMGALQATVFFLFLLKACEINAQNEDWETATATYSKETNGSIITGTFLVSIVSKFVTLLSFTT